MTHTGPDGDVLALDIGGTKIAAGIVDSCGRVRDRATVPTPARLGARAVLDAALDLSRQVTGGMRPVAVGIGSAGVIDPVRGVVTHATDALPGWPGTDLAGAFGEAFAVPAAALNDVHAHALGEAAYGAGRQASSLLLVAVGTGIGGAHVLDGQVLTGARHVAGHIGHLPVPEAQGVPCSCGRVGHLEGLASGPGLLAAFRRAGGEASSTYDVVRFADTAPEGDPAGDLARELLDTIGRATGRVIGGLLNMLDPETVVLTGGMAAVGERWWSAVCCGMALEAMDVVSGTPLLPAAAGPDAALLGAAAFVRNRIGGP